MASWQLGLTAKVMLAVLGAGIHIVLVCVKALLALLACLALQSKQLVQQILLEHCYCLN